MAEVYRTSWDSVIRSVKMAVAWGLEHRNLDGVTAIGIDEIARGKGQNKYVTLAYQIDADSKRLLWIGEERTQKDPEEVLPRSWTPDHCSRWDLSKRQ